MTNNQSYKPKAGLTSLMLLLQVAFDKSKITKHKAKNVWGKLFKGSTAPATEEMRSRSRLSTSTGRSVSKVGTQVTGGTQSGSGFTMNDLTLGKIIISFFQMTSVVNLCKVQEEERAQKIGDILTFSTVIMNCQYHRQIAISMSQNLPKLLGFEHATIFFLEPAMIKQKKGKDSIYTKPKKDNLFTVSTHPCERKIKDPQLQFAYEIIFPDDQVVVFPCDMGISGDVFVNNSYMIENSHGVIIKKGERKIDLELEEEPSYKLNTSAVNSSISRMGNQKMQSKSLKQSPIKASTVRKEAIGATLEKIVEDVNP